MDWTLWGGVIGMTLLTILFLGPGMWSSRTDYPIVTWIKKLLSEPKRDAPSDKSPRDGHKDA